MILHTYLFAIVVALALAAGAMARATRRTP